MTMPPNALHHLKQQIENYQGYAEVDSRQKSDKEMRLFLINKIRELVEKLAHNYSTDNSKAKDRLESLLSSTSRKLVTIHQSLKTPTYIEEAFFQTATIPEAQLDRIYNLEDNMLLETKSIRDELEDLLKDKKDRDAIEDHFIHIDAYVDNINQALFEREALILGDE